ncbi:efflux RND transporter periplasmic adaptor subunit [Ekhidna sp. To15]|uniref:efflux RND transporter periplasmic adaptor subunit n=1 Tax=Ekhidna sp. To15 TaxID=3395267 RepID=UPI003F51E8AA
MKRKLIIILSSVGILVLAVVLAGAFAEQKEDPKNQRPQAVTKTVQTKQVNYQTIQTDVVSYGRVQTAQTLDLLSEVSGRMYQGKVRLKAGERFRKGDLLFYIDDKEPVLNLKSQKSNFLRDLAGILPDMKVDFNDNFEAWKAYFNSLDIDKKFGPLPEATSEKEKIFLATKGIYSTYYTIKSAEARLDKHRYYAPFDGSIMEVTLQSGSFINPGVSIGKVMRRGVHELKVAIETKDIPWIKDNSPVKIYSDETDQYLEGRVTRISDFVNQNTQSVDVFIAIQSSESKIYDGQFFQAAIPARTIKDGMIMPRNAIYNGNEVFVVEDTLLKVRKINVIRLADEEAIVSGLDRGVDLVIEPLIGGFNNMVVEKQEVKDIDFELGEAEEAVNTGQAPTASN